MECLLLPEGRYVEIVIFRNGHRSLFEHGRELAVIYRTVPPVFYINSLTDAHEISEYSVKHIENCNRIHPK